MAMKGVLTKEKLTAQFPHVHIANLGGGTVGPIYLFRDEHGTITHAEAELHDAPFSKMLIDTPELLRAFDDQGRKFDLDLLERPWPRLRLVEHEPWKFEIGSLVVPKYVRSEDGHDLCWVKGQVYIKRRNIVTSTAEEPMIKVDRPKRVRSSPQPRRSSGRTTRKEESNSSSSSVRSTSKVQKTRPPPPPAAPKVAPKVSAAESEMLAIRTKLEVFLSEEDKQQFNYFLTTGITRSGKQGQKYRDLLRPNIRRFLDQQRESRDEVIRLYHSWVELQNQTEPRWTRHLPTFKDLNVGDEEMASTQAEQ